jgi:hypothetical protein
MKLRLIILTLVVDSFLSACSNVRPPNPAPSQNAHSVDPDGVAVSDAPEPEVVRLVSVTTVLGEKHITVGNLAGDYVLVCNEDANDKAKHPFPSCMLPRPQMDYLLFRNNTKWLVRGAKVPMSLSFMQDFTVSYNESENVGLLKARDRSSEEPFGVYRLSSWTVKNPSTR